MAPDSTQLIELATPLDTNSRFPPLKVAKSASRGETIRIQGECRIKGVPWPTSRVSLISRNEPDHSQNVKIWAQNDPEGNVDVRLTIALHFPSGPVEVNMTCVHDDVLTPGSDTYIVQIGNGPIKDVDDLAALSKAERATVKPFRINVQPSTVRPGDALSIANTPDSLCQGTWLAGGGVGVVELGF